MIIFKFLFFFFFIINKIQFSNGLNLKNLNSSYTIKTANLLDTPTKILSGSIDFNETLYYLETFTCPISECPEYPTDCPPCDYTHNGCNIGYSNRPANCEPCNQRISDRVNILPCNQAWKDLELGVEQDGFIDTFYTSYSMFRFYAPEKCSGYKITVKTIQGQPFVSVDLVPFYPLSTGAAINIQTFQMDTTITLCPNSPLFSYNDFGNYRSLYPYGTLHISALNKGQSDCIFKIKIEEIDITPPPAIAPPPCENVNPDYQCLNDGQSVYIGELKPAGTFLKYSFKIDSCKNITITTVSLLNDVDIFATDNPLNFSSSNYKWSSTYSMDDSLFFNICPNENENFKIIYIGINMVYTTDIYFFISTLGDYKLREITNNPTLAGTWAFTGVSNLYDSKSGTTYQCDNYEANCLEYFPVFPRKDNNPLYPVPAIFGLNGQSLSKFLGIAINETDNPAKSNVFQYGILMSVDVYGIQHVYIEPSQLDTLEIVFLGKLFFGNGTAIVGSVPIGNQVVPECNFKDFSKVDQQQDEILDSFDESQTSQVSGMRYYLDLLAFSDEYYACSFLADSFLEFNTTTSIQNTTACVGNSLSSSYLNDPCCTTFATFSKCCRPRPTEITTTTFLNVKEDLVNDQCAFPQCAESVLNTYATSVSTGTEFNQCLITQDEESFYSDSVYVVFRQCNQLFEPEQCRVDSDCNIPYPGKNYRCNVRNGVCLIPYLDLEYKFIECILDNIAAPLKTEVISSKNLTHLSQDKDQLIQALYNAFPIQDCATDYNAAKWAKLTFIYTAGDAINQYCYPYTRSFDQSGPLAVYDSCHQGLNSYTWIGESFSPSICNSIVRCDWRGFEGSVSYYGTFDTTDLVDDCNTNTPDYFCGDCSDPMRGCFVDPSFTDQTSCENGNYACYVQDHNPEVFGDYGLPTVQNPSECLNLTGSCSVNCGYECAPQSACFIPTDDQEHPSCNQIGNDAGEPFDDGITYQCAYRSINKTICATYPGSIFKDCGDFTTDQCTVCNDPNEGCAGFGMYCYLNTIPCSTQEQCEAAGSCSDEYYFQSWIGDYPPYQPRCAFPRTFKSIYSNGLPTCEFPIQQDTPFGCIDLQFPMYDQASCEQDGGYWWSGYSSTKQECLAYDNLCYAIDRSPGSLLPLTGRFNEKNEQDCECAGETWREPFTWTQGVWTPGYAAPLKWTPVNKTNPLTQISSFKTTLEMGRFFTAFKDAASVRTRLLYKSSILCHNSNSKNSLNALSCGCTDNQDSNDSCYNDLGTPVLKVIKPCYDPSNTTIFNNGELDFQTGSIRENSCVSISIGQIYKESFLSKRVIALSSTFVSFDKPDDYSIFNSNKAVIGKLLADGLNLEIFDTGINNFKLCMSSSISRNSKKNPIIDFAILTNDQLGQIIPLSCSIEIDLLNRYCCLITSDNINNNLIVKEEEQETSGSSGSTAADQKDLKNYIKVGKISIFLIERISNWENESFKPFNKSSTGLLYVLGVFFCIMGVYGLLHIAFFIAQRIISTEPFKLVHLLFLVLTAFSLIRSIYFFVLPSGVISETTTVGNYILVVLPTFLYFTAFTIVIVIWYMLSSASSFDTSIYRRINLMILLINAILYIIFIIIVIVFNFTKESSPPTCDGRLLVDLKQTTPQNVVSILYAVLQACLSLAIGVAFIYYGRLIYKKLSKLSTQTSPTASKQQNRTFIITIICSTGFVLHCIFIIILVSVNPSNIVFSFIGLIVTEMIPVIVLYVTNNQIPINRYTRKGVKSIIKLRSNNTSSTISETYSNNTTSTSTSKNLRSSTSTSQK